MRRCILALASLLFLPLSLTAADAKPKAPAKPAIPKPLHLDFESEDSNEKAHLKISGDGASLVKGMRGAALRLRPGSSVTLVVAEPDTPQPSGTVEFWIKTTWDGNDGKEHVLLSLGGDGADGMRLIKNAGGSLRLSHPSPAGNEPLSIPAKRVWRHDDWRHLACVWSKESASIFLDGVAVAQARFHQAPPVPKVMPLVIGGESADAVYDELELHYTALYPGQILTAHARGREELENDLSPNLSIRVAINGKPARVLWDTGCTYNILFNGMVQRAGLTALADPAGNGKIGDNSFHASLQFAPDQPPGETAWRASPQEMGFEIDGILGWLNVMSENAMLLSWGERTMRSLSKDDLVLKPEDGYYMYKFNPALGSLRIEDVPFQIAGLKENVRVMIDTGEPGGFYLNGILWDRIQAELAGKPRSITIAWNPITGHMVERMYLFDEIRLFDTVLKKASVGRDNLEAARARSADHKPELRIGIEALSYFDMVYHGPRGELWLKPRKQRALNPRFDLSGVAILPRAPGENPRIEVDEDGKAWQMGLRSGDEVLELDGAPLPAPRSEPVHFVTLSRRIDGNGPVKVKVRREGNVLEVERK